MVMQLVKKDFIYLTTSLKSTCVMLLIFAFCMPLANVGIGCVMPALVCYIGFYNLLAYEERNKMNLLNLSLPVQRRDICLAKYIQVVIFMIIGSMLSIMGILMMQTMSTDSMFWADKIGTLFLAMFSIALVYSAIMLPCMFYFGTIKSRYVSLITYIIIFVAASHIDVKMIEHIVQIIKGIGNGGANIIGILVAMLLFVISYTISVRIWEAKEF